METAKLIDHIADPELKEKAEAVYARHPRFSFDQVMSEATFLLAARSDRQALTLEQLDIEARREESEAAHADEANSGRAFTKRAMVN